MNTYAARRIAGHQLKRVRQTPGTFANWPQLLWGLAAERVGKGPETLTFSTRSGRRISCPNGPGARVPVYEVFAEDCYRLGWFLGPLAERPIHVLDVGAHVGTFTCQLTQVHRGASVECFEPSAATAEFLRRNIVQNGLGSRVTVAEAALAGATGFAVFDDNGAGSGLNGLVHDDGTVTSGAAARGTATKVATRSFDDVVAAAPAPVDLVKMDCEGGEYDLVYASTPQNWASVQRVVLEYHPIDGQSWDALRDWFAAVGLNEVRRRPVREGLGTAWLSREPLPPQDR